MTTTRRRRRKVPPLRYFFYEGDLHKKLHINRGDDLITAWNYPKTKMVQLSYTSVRKEGKKAFSTTQVAQMVNRNSMTIARVVREGFIERPQMTYGIDEDKQPHAFYWSEDDIMRLHEHLKTVHIGRPRKDGRVNPGNLPTATELRAMIRQNVVLYVKSEDGSFVPTWDANRL